MNCLDIREIRKKIGVSQKKLAEMLDVHWRTVQNWETNGGISQSDYTKLCALLPEEELKEMRYYGEMQQEPTPEHGFLPLIPIEAVAGFPTIQLSGVELPFCDTYFVPEFVTRGAQFLIRVSGDSMYPKYSNGDLLACRKIEEITFLQWGVVYVLDTIQGALVKRLFESPNPDFVICHSDNQEQYPRFTLPKSDIRSLSIVVGVIRLE